MLFFRKKTPLTPMSEYREEYILILSNLSKILSRNNSIGKKQFIEFLINCLNENQLDKFQREINSLDMWGGAGAVWDIYIEDENLYKDFKNNIIKLIDLMEKSQKLKRSVRSVRNIFKFNKNDSIIWDVNSIERLKKD